MKYKVIFWNMPQDKVNIKHHIVYDVWYFSSTSF